MILKDDRNGKAVGDPLVVLDDPIVIRHRLLRRRHHHGVCAKVLCHACEVLCGLRAGMAGADDNRRATIRGRHGRPNERFTFAVRQPVGLAQNTEDRDAVDLEAHHELDESLPRFEVDAFVVMKGRGEDRE